MLKNKDKFFSRSLKFQENRLLVQCLEKYTFLKANHEFKDFLYWNFITLRSCLKIQIIRAMDNGQS